MIDHVENGQATALNPIDLDQDIPVASNPMEVNREATRWLFFAGDILTPAQKRGRADLKHGGEYFGQHYKTLVRSRGLLRRLQITPLEIGFDFLPDEQTGGEEGMIVNVLSNEPNPNDRTLKQSLNAVRVYPGDEIKGILREATSETAKGYVELEGLQGVNYAEFKESGLQGFIFPYWDKVMAGVENIPNKLSEIVQGLQSVKTSDDSIKDIIGEMLAGCETYKLWGTNYLKTSSQLVKTPMTGGFVHTYSPIAEMLFEQLEIKREDLISRDSDLVDIISKVNAGNSVSNDDMKSLIAVMAKNQELLVQLAAEGKLPLVEKVPEIEVEKAKCSELKANGEPCNGSPMDNGKCVFHQPKGE